MIDFCSYREAITEIATQQMLVEPLPKIYAIVHMRSPSNIFK